MGRAVKNSLEIIIKQVRLEGGFERGGRIRVAECLRLYQGERESKLVFYAQSTSDYIRVREKEGETEAGRQTNRQTENERTNERTKCLVQLGHNLY